MMSKKIRKSEEQREIYPSVIFKSIVQETFRIQLNEEKKGILTVHIEARNSKKQWSSYVGNEKSSVINGIPTDGVFRALRVIKIY